MSKKSFILLRPLVTEKISNLQEKENKYAFEVRRDANKIEIKDAIESKFNVRVKSVRTMQVLGKTKRLGRYEGRRRSWKKAIVTLEKDFKIDLFESE
ncbi:50S ribosomal protein L23 [candidate division KSB1 bacterium]